MKPFGKKEYAAMKRISVEKLNSFAKESRVTPEFKKKLAAYEKYKKKFGSRTLTRSASQ